MGLSFENGANNLSQARKFSICRIRTISSTCSHYFFPEWRHSTFSPKLWVMMSSRWPLGLVAAVSASAVCFVILKLGCKRLSSSAGSGGEIAFRWPERHCDWPSRPRGGCRTAPSCLWLFISPHEREHYFEMAVSTRVSTIYLLDFSNQLNSDLCVIQEYRVKGNGVVSQIQGSVKRGTWLDLKSKTSAYIYSTHIIWQRPGVCRTAAALLFLLWLTTLLTISVKTDLPVTTKSTFKHNLL
jgi:hypothetical protein